MRKWGTGSHLTGVEHRMQERAEGQASSEKRSESEGCSVMSDSLQPHGLYSPWNSPGQNTELSLSPGIKPRSPAWQADSLPAEQQRKPKNTGVGSPSLLQRIFLSQELNQGLLHYRQILYQLSYQGSPWRRELWPILENLECQVQVTSYLSYKSSKYTWQNM